MFWFSIKVHRAGYVTLEAEVSSFITGYEPSLLSIHVILVPAELMADVAHWLFCSTWQNYASLVCTGRLSWVQCIGASFSDALPLYKVFWDSCWDSQTAVITYLHKKSSFNGLIWYFRYFRLLLANCLVSLLSSLLQKENKPYAT